MGALGCDDLQNWFYTDRPKEALCEIYGLSKEHEFHKDILEQDEETGKRKSNE